MELNEKIIPKRIPEISIEEILNIIISVSERLIEVERKRLKPSKKNDIVSAVKTGKWASV